MEQETRFILTRAIRDDRRRTRLKVGIINPELETLPTGETVCSISIRDGTALGLVKDIVDWLTAISGIPDPAKTPDEVP